MKNHVSHNRRFRLSGRLLIAGLIFIRAVTGGPVEAAVRATVAFFRSPYLQSVSESSVTICWETTEPATGTVFYREKGSEEGFVAEAASSLRQEVLLTGLRQGTAYHYEVRLPSEAPEASLAGSFRTAPVEPAEFAFVVYGDSRHNATAHEQIVAAIRSVQPAFVINLGDIVDAGGSQYGWDMFWGIVAPLGDSQGLAANVPIFPALGNHEYNNGALGGYEQPYSEQAVSVYQANFALPPNGLEGEHPEWSERFYSFRYGPALFIVLDVNNDSDPEYDTNYALEPPGPPDIHPGSPQYNWMIELLQKGKRECAFTFVCFHHALYSSGPRGNPANSSSGYRLRFLDEVFRRYGVDMVFTAHDHFYERCETCIGEYPIVYYVTGAGGAPMYQKHADWESWMWDDVNETYYSKFFDNASNSFIKVDIIPEGEGMWRAKTCGVRQSQETFDDFEISRDQPSKLFLFSFDGMSIGSRYQVIYTEDLLNDVAEWTLFGGPFVSESESIEVIDDGTETGVPPTRSSVRQRFYRLKELP